jgi:hypothetical protein
MKADKPVKSIKINKTVHKELSIFCSEEEKPIMETAERFIKEGLKREKSKK